MERTLSEISREIRLLIIKMYYRAGWGHFAPALSCVDILTTLYFGGFIQSTKLEDLQRVVLSKGHGGAALYAILAMRGVIPQKELNSFYQDGTRLGGLAGNSVPGIDIPTGSLGHGICYATGLAMAKKIDGSIEKIYTLVGDGETQEGSVWEAAMFSGNQGLENLVVIIDRNRIQCSDWIERINPLDPVESKWKAFGWDVYDCDGNDCDALEQTLHFVSEKCTGKPAVVIANTVKGKGVAMAESQPGWHSRAPRGAEWDEICKEWGISRAELEEI